MKEKKNILERLSSGKGFYITAAFSLLLIIGAIAFVYNSSINMLHDLDIPTTLQQAEKNQTDVEDPRSADDDSEDEYREDESDGNAEINREHQQSTVKVEPSTHATTTETQPVEVFSNDSFILPLSGDIDRRFSMSPVYDETMEDWRIHKGIDILCKSDEEVKSIGNGKVIKVIADPVWGYSIEVDYGKFTAKYCGLKQGTTVIIDDTVSKGDIIGQVSSIPCESKQENHLHFEIIRDGVWIDPTSIIGS